MRSAATARSVSTDTRVAGDFDESLAGREKRLAAVFSYDDFAWHHLRDQRNVMRVDSPSGLPRPADVTSLHIFGVDRALRRDDFQL